MAAVVVGLGPRPEAQRLVLVRAVGTLEAPAVELGLQTVAEAVRSRAVDGSVRGAVATLGRLLPPAVARPRLPRCPVEVLSIPRPVLSERDVIL